jgi:glucosylceramidase
VNSSKRFQEILGIGGAITDASAEVFARLSPARQDELVKAYYNRNTGIGYSLARTTIHSSDFSSASYTYVRDGDAALASFSIDHDRRYRIPLIKRAIAGAGGGLLLYASPWSPPAFMKSNGSMLRGGHLLPQYRAAWATYYTKFIKAYEREGIPIWGITVQNEPMAKQTWESSLLTATEERDFLKDHLGPTMRREGLGRKKIVVWDHNRDLMVDRANVLFSDPAAARYAWGIGYHWYETWKGGSPMHSNVARVAEAFPDKKLLFTEGSNEAFKSDQLQSWSNAERYGRQMISDFNAGTVGWTDWNILLDERGGPNHVGNYCFAPVHADTRDGSLIYTPAYYYIGHFSKFIRPGARRISTASTFSGLLATSFINPDNSAVSVVMNDTDRSITYSLVIDGRQTAAHIAPHSIQSIVYQIKGTPQIAPLFNRD